jgi:hypothetical protein
MQLTPKNASVVPPEDGRLTPEACRGSRHKKVIVKVKVHYVGYVIVIHLLCFVTHHITCPAANLCFIK